MRGSATQRSPPKPGWPWGLWGQLSRGRGDAWSKRTTGSTPARGTMRHIPEDELHAYLDQGLSRSQCVEIESHLAGCSSCQAARDGIAALRDRTTALLTRLAPPRCFPPEFESLRRRAASQVSARRRRIQRAVWAASLMAAVGLGWTASFLLHPAEPASRLAAVPVVALPALDRAPTPAVQKPVRQDSPAFQRT